MTKENAINQLFGTLIWSSDLDDYSIDDFIEEDAKRLENLFNNFWQSNMELIEGESQDLSQIAHDFILTCNGHGAGFWDGDYIKGDLLTEICKPYGTFDPYVTDDNKISISFF